MKQFGKIFGFELKGYFKNKIFVGVTIFLVAAIAVVMFIPNIASLFGSGGENKRPIMLVSSSDAQLLSIVGDYFDKAFGDYEVRVTDESIEDIRKEILSGEAECAFVLDGITSYTYYVDNLSLSDGNILIADSVIQEIYRLDAMIRYGLTPEQAAQIMTTEIESTTATLGKDQVKNFFYTYIMIFALYMVILLYGQMVASGVATEKSSRAMELLITSAKPVNMMFGKVLAACLAGLIQLIAIFGSALIFYNINKNAWSGNLIMQSIFNIPVDLFLYLPTFFILGFLIYAFLYGAIGSTASKLEDINTSVMPITFLFIIAFFVVIFSMMNGNVDNTVMKICSYVPFTSPMAMFTRIAMSSVAWYEIVVSIGILMASVIGVGFLAARIYRVGVLLYGTRPKLGAIIKMLFRR